jgi:hypothetical protein
MKGLKKKWDIWFSDFIKLKTFSTSFSQFTIIIRVAKPPIHNF